MQGGGEKSRALRQRDLEASRREAAICQIFVRNRLDAGMARAVWHGTRKYVLYIETLNGSGKTAVKRKVRKNRVVSIGVAKELWAGFGRSRGKIL